MIGTWKELHYLSSGSNKSYISYLKSWDRNQKGPWKTVSVNGTNTTVVVPPENGGLFEISPSYLLVRVLLTFDAMHLMTLCIGSVLCLQS